jgi:prephenate dehydrogenase
MRTLDQLVLDENNIAFHPLIGNSYQLNEIAKEIIVALRHHKSKEEIIEELAQQYDVSKEDLFIDVSDFLAKLKIYGLL